MQACEIVTLVVPPNLNPKTLQEMFSSEPSMACVWRCRMNGAVKVAHAMAPFSHMYCARDPDPLCAAAVIAMTFNMDFQTLAELSQVVDDGNGHVIRCHSDENLDGWPSESYQLLCKVMKRVPHQPGETPRIILATHAQFVGGLIAWTKGITGARGISAEINDPLLQLRAITPFRMDEEGKLTRADPKEFFR